MQNILNKKYHNSGNADVLRHVNGIGTILDVGCGVGDNARILKNAGHRVDGITISETELKEALPFLNAGYLHNLENGLPEKVKENKYDYIICSHVLEHICYPEKLLNDLQHCLKTDGQLIVALPNLFHYNSRWKLVKGEFSYQDAGIWDNTHFKWYTYQTGVALLENNGFTVVHKTVTGLLPGNSLFSKILSKKTSLVIYNLLKKVSPGLFGYQLLYIATAKQV